MVGELVGKKDYDKVASTGDVEAFGWAAGKVDERVFSSVDLLGLFEVDYLDDEQADEMVGGADTLLA